MEQRTRTALVGRNISTGERIFVQIRTSVTRKDQNTTEHTTLAAGAPLVSFMGSVVGKGRRSVSAAGQVLSDIKGENIQPAAGWNDQDIASLLQLWESVHLSNMHAECAHMDLPANRDYDARKDLVCEQTGYRYGSDWLARPLTAAELAETARLMNLPTGKVPDYL